MRALQRNHYKLILILLIGTVLVPHPAQAQTAAGYERPTTESRQSDEGFALLTYDVNDLVLNVPDYPYTQTDDRSRGLFGRSYAGGVSGYGGGGMGGMGGDGTSPPWLLEGDMSAAAPGVMNGRITMMDLTRVIVAVISPESWSNNRGPGELQVLGSSLVVRQSPAVHEEIQGLLDQLRKGSGMRKTVSIDARWLLLNSDELEKLVAAPADGKGTAQVDRKVLAEYTRRASSIRGLTNCFTGQLVYLISGTRQSVVTGVVPVVGSIGNLEDAGTQFASVGSPGIDVVFTAQGGPGVGAGMGGMQPSLIATGDRSVGYQPVVERPNFGALLEIRPTLIPGDNSAIVDLQSTITVPGESTIKSVAQPHQAMNVPVVDRLAVDTQQLATTLSVPLGKPVLVGGLTYIAPTSLALTPTPAVANRQAPPTGTETPQLYLILELRPGSDK